MVKQATQICMCGQAVDFPEGEVRKVCRTCGALWEINDGGVWFTQSVMVFEWRSKRETRRGRRLGRETKVE